MNRRHFVITGLCALVASALKEPTEVFIAFVWPTAHVSAQCDTEKPVEVLVLDKECNIFKRMSYEEYCTRIEYRLDFNAHKTDLKELLVIDDKAYDSLGVILIPNVESKDLITFEKFGGDDVERPVLNFEHRPVSF